MKRPILTCLFGDLLFAGVVALAAGAATGMVGYFLIYVSGPRP